MCVCVCVCVCVFLKSFLGLVAQGGKESACSAGGLDSIPGLGRFPGKENGYPLQYYCLEISMNRGAWQAAAHGVTKSWTQLSNFHYPPIKKKSV